MNHVHDSQETTPLEVAWQNFLREAGLATAVTASKYFDEALKARIAAELPNIAKAVLNHPLDKLGDPIECDTFAEALAPQPVAAGDVPEWLTDYERTYIDRFDTQSLWDAFKAELSRRVAEATAAKSAKLGEAAGALFRIQQEQGSLKQQLATAQAEVSRLTSEIIGNLKVIPGAIRVREGGADEDVAKSLAVSVAKLVDENKRLTRPVEGDWWAVVSGRSVFAICKWQDRAEEYLASHCPSGAVERIHFDPDAVGKLRQDLQSERNAREQAEAEKQSTFGKATTD